MAKEEPKLIPPEELPPEMPDEEDGGRKRDPETLTMDRITRLLDQHEPGAQADIIDYLYRRYCRRNGGQE